MKIEIAGAGAGKTTNLAQKIISCYMSEKNKIIYCVSFTNSSVQTITEKLEAYFGVIPDNIRISTIHSFLYTEIISPYFYLLYGKQYHDVVNTPLNSNPRFKRHSLKQLEEKGLLHVVSFTEKAKFVICGKSGEKKAIREKRKKLVKLFLNSFHTLFIDEAQDIDQLFKKILIELDSQGSKIQLIGDPKQDLRGFETLQNLIELFPDDVNYLANCHRCASVHLKLSNYFISEKERQISPTDKLGSLNYYFESDIDDPNIFIKEQVYDLVYIYRKSGDYSTKKSNEKNYLFEELKLFIRKLAQIEGKDVDENQIRIIASKLSVKLQNLVLKNGRSYNEALNQIFGKIEDKSDYAKLKVALEMETKINPNQGTLVSSIERVKGLGKPKCLFIVTPALLPYFFKEKVDGKVAACLYVALTRSEFQLDLLFTKDVEKKYSKERIIEFMINILS